MGHQYTVVRVNRNSAGTVTSVVLRNPWGVDGAGSDGSDDGFVTLTTAQIYAHQGAVNWGRVSVVDSAATRGSPAARANLFSLY